MTADSKSDKPTITATTRMGDAIRLDPDLPMVLMRFHIGGCSMCGFEQDDTVEDVAEANGVPLEDLLAALTGPEADPELHGENATEAPVIPKPRPALGLSPADRERSELPLEIGFRTPTMAAPFS
jgi:hypothetical protein